MRKHQLQLIFIALTLVLLILGLIDCTSSSYQPLTQSSITMTTPSPTPQAADATATQIAFISWAAGVPPEAVIDIRDHDPTKYVQLEDIARAHIAEATELALTPRQPHPIYTPWPTDTPGPSPTTEIDLGMMVSCETAGQGEFVLNSCWRGILDGRIISVGVGVRNFNREGIPGTPSYTDHTNGWIVVSNGPYLHASDPNLSVYETPAGVGIIGMTSVDNNVLTLIPVTFYSQPRSGPNIYFDLVSRQFLYATGTPIPTTPVPRPGP